MVAPLKLVIAAFGLIVVLVSTIELWHYQRHGDLLPYGWHVDVMSSRADYGIPGVSTEYWTRTTNATPIPEIVEFCIMPNDVEPFELPVAAFQIETRRQNEVTWEGPFPDVQVACPTRIVRKRIWPLGNFETSRGMFGAGGLRKGDWLRFIVFTSFSSTGSSARGLVSRPVQLTEQLESR